MEEATVPLIHGKIPGGLDKNEKRLVSFLRAPLSTHYRPRLRPFSSREPRAPECLIAVSRANRAVRKSSAISLRDGDGARLIPNRAHPPESDQMLSWAWSHGETRSVSWESSHVSTHVIPNMRRFDFRRSRRRGSGSVATISLCSASMPRCVNICLREPHRRPGHAARA